MQPSQTALFLALCLGPASQHVFITCTAWVPTSDTAPADTAKYLCVYLMQPTLQLAPSHLSTLPDSRTAEIKVRARKVSDPTTAPFSRICRPILEGIVSWSRMYRLYARYIAPHGWGLHNLCRLYPDVGACVCAIYAKYVCTYIQYIQSRSAPPKWATEDSGSSGSSGGHTRLMMLLLPFLTRILFPLVVQRASGSAQAFAGAAVAAHVVSLT